MQPLKRRVNLTPQPRLPRGQGLVPTTPLALHAKAVYNAWTPQYPISRNVEECAMPTTEALKAAVQDAIDRRGHELIQVATTILQHPEPGFREQKTSQLV